jgi:hypothetical protein
MFVSHHRRKFLMSSLIEKVNMMKYMPLSLRVSRPMKRASIKLTRPPMTITTGRDNACPSIAEVYTPTPKKAADASDI